MNQLLETGRLFLILYEREVTSLVLTLPRVYLFVYVSQIMGLQAVPRLIRNVMILVLTAFAAPINLAPVSNFDGSVPAYALYFLKEAVIGLLLGYIVGWIFWALQAAGTLIDNQRGAAIAGSIDPLHGHETTPLGTLFSQAFLTYTFVTGAILHVIMLLFQSFALWPAGQLVPDPAADLPLLALSIADAGTRLLFVLAAPIVVLMFLSEFALALVSRFAPQVQVFILAMPIKSALAVLILIFYASRLLPYATQELMGTELDIRTLLNAVMNGGSGTP